MGVYKKNTQDKTLEFSSQRLSIGQRAKIVAWKLRGGSILRSKEEPTVPNAPETTSKMTKEVYLLDLVTW